MGVALFRDPNDESKRKVTSAKHAAKALHKKAWANEIWYGSDIVDAGKKKKKKGLGESD